MTGGSRIRVLQIITSLGIGGAERLVVSAAAGLPRSRFEQAICCLADRGPLAAEAEGAGIRVFCVGEYPGVRHPLAFARLVRTIRAYRPTIVHTHLQAANLYGRLAARLARVPIVVATEHNVYTGKARRYVAVERWLARTTDALIAVSDEVRRFMTHQLGLAPSAVRIVPNGVTLLAASPSQVAAIQARTGGASLRLGTVASLTAKKGHEHLLRALALVRERGIGCSLVLAGDGAERERLERLRDELGLAGQVQFLGAVSNVADVLAAVDVFVLPSVVEGLPLALLEAMLAGKAVIATSVGGVPEVVRAGVNGLLVPPANPRGLADAIAALSESPEQRARFGAAARDTIERGFTESVYLESLTAVYLELVGSLAR